ncbi:hypothetical protein GR328_24330 [Microvirga makkahensis]|uniref:Blue (type 1) copper domain-containing protein n=1 Tax=Microvirga makkahensis TaxID=1128670 RepID=A0A7X3MWJ3_9HYPH|nr:hypothetical protein [Microvirga makkahensis]
MQTNADDSHGWSDQAGLRIEPGQTIRWSNLPPGNSHATTAFHPKNFKRPLRIPQSAEPWNSDCLLPNDTLPVTPTVEGIYDFYCVPHEHAGMVGRIIVGRPGRSAHDSFSRRRELAGGRSLRLRSAPSRPSARSCALAADRRPGDPGRCDCPDRRSVELAAMRFRFSLTGTENDRIAPAGAEHHATSRDGHLLGPPECRAPQSTPPDRAGISPHLSGALHGRIAGVSRGIPLARVIRNSSRFTYSGDPNG